MAPFQGIPILPRQQSPDEAILTSLPVRYGEFNRQRQPPPVPANVMRGDPFMGAPMLDLTACGWDEPIMMDDTIHPVQTDSNFANGVHAAATPAPAVPVLAVPAPAAPALAIPAPAVPVLTAPALATPALATSSHPTHACNGPASPARPRIASIRAARRATTALTPAAHALAATIPAPQQQATTNLGPRPDPQYLNSTGTKLSWRHEDWLAGRYPPDEQIDRAFNHGILHPEKQANSFGPNRGASRHRTTRQFDIKRYKDKMASQARRREKERQEKAAERVAAEKK